MKLNEYQELTNKTDGYSTVYKTAEVVPDYVYYALGLAGEAGETVDQVKKICREGGMPCDQERMVKILHELGDCLWYIARLSDAMGFTLEEVANSNIVKLEARYNKLQKEKKK